MMFTTEELETLAASVRFEIKEDGIENTPGCVFEILGKIVTELESR